MTESKTEDYPDVKGSEEYAERELIGKKENFIPKEDHPVRRQLLEGLKLAGRAEAVEEADAKIEVVFVYPCISKRTVAHVVKCGRLLRFRTGLHYVVEISGEIWDRLTQTVQTKVLEHECRHILIEFKDTNLPVFRLLAHDVQDFRAQLEKYGVNWFYELDEAATEAADSEEVIPAKV